jgi:hypothetical protein
MTNALRAALAAIAAGALFTAVQGASAQPVNGCPAGEAMQAADPSGRNVRCVPIPDAAALQSQIDALRAGIGEESIAGQYAFSGPYTCIQSSTGFNNDLTPRSPTQGGPSAFIQVQHGITTGFRTFNADGTGTVEFYTQTITGPGVFYGYFLVPPPPPMPGSAPPSDTPVYNFSLGVATNGGVPRPSGNAGASRTSGRFTWQLVGGQLLIEESGSDSGTIVEGAGAGLAITVRDLPPVVGIIGKDRRSISITHQRMQVETTSTVLADGTVRETSRVCIRERLLRKL